MVLTTIILLHSQPAPTDFTQLVIDKPAVEIKLSEASNASFRVGYRNITKRNVQIRFSPIQCILLDSKGEEVQRNSYGAKTKLNQMTGNKAKLYSLAPGETRWFAYGAPLKEFNIAPGRYSLMFDAVGQAGYALKGIGWPYDQTLVSQKITVTIKP
ncbi:MAG: hypothetical protein JSS72_12035 [Armatimonadetes bacterium]|nr:hypothetical protein [Armatimonadota bacterium]